MSPEHDDPLIDSLLDEVVGGRTPPDLSSKIMQAWSAGGVAHSEIGDAWPPNVSLPLPTHGADAHAPEPPPIIAAYSPIAEPASSNALVALSGGQAIHRARRDRRSQRVTIAAGLALVAAVLVIGLTVAVVANRPQQHNRADT